MNPDISDFTEPNDYTPTTSEKIGRFIRKTTAWFMLLMILMFVFSCAYVSIYYYFFL